MKLQTIFMGLLVCLYAQYSVAAEHTVHMKNSGTAGVMVFEPGLITIAPGDTVHFEPTDMGHNSESIPALIPEGAPNWKGDFSKKTSVSFDKEGVYIYQCLPHAVMGMVGVVVVGKPTNLSAIQADANALGDSFVMNKERLKGLLSQIE